jgi:hypothetical protein
MERPVGGDSLFSVRDVDPGEDQHPQLAHLVPDLLCRERWPSPSEITPFLPWEMSAEKRLELATDPIDSS